jgi:hypothetical protein
VVALVLTSCGGTAPAEQEEEEEEEEEEEIIEEPTEVLVLNLGESYKSMVNTVAITVNSTEFMDSYDYVDARSNEPGVAEAEEGEHFLIIYAKIEFLGDGKAHSFEGRARFFIFDDEGKRYKPALYRREEEALGVIRTFSPGMDMEGKVCFEIPKDATGLVITAWTLAVPAQKVAEWPLE